MKITKRCCRTGIIYLLLLFFFCASLIQFKHFVVDMPLGLDEYSSFKPLNKTTDMGKLPLAISSLKSEENNIIVGEVVLSNPSMVNNSSLYIPYYRGNIRIWADEKLIHKSENNTAHFPSGSLYGVKKLDSKHSTHNDENHNHAQIHSKHMEMNRALYDQEIDKFNGSFESHDHSNLSIRSAIIPLTNIFDNKDKVVIKFLLESQKNKNYSLLSKFYIGEFSEFSKSEDRKAIYYHIFQPIVAAAMILSLILMSLLASAFRFHEILPVLCILIFRAGISLQEFVFLIPSLSLISTYSIILVPIALVGFHEFLLNLRLDSKNQINWRIYIFGIVLSGIYFMVYFYYGVNQDTSRLLMFPIWLFGLGFIIIRSFFIMLNQKAEKVRNINDMIFFSVALSTWFFVLAHDIFGRLGFLDITIPLSSSANLLVVTILGSILFRQVLNSKNNLELFNVMLSAELKEQSDKLTQEYEVQERIQKALAIKEEYARINEDLHDGILTYLYSIKTLSEKSNNNNEKVHTLSQFALNELRVILKSNINRKSSLILILSNFREHVIDTLEVLNIHVVWDSRSLVDLNEMDLKTNLEILRVVQEAIHNAINRAKCTNLHFITNTNSTGYITFQILNFGGKTFSEKNKKGHGIENMKARIERLNGEFSISSQPGGAIIEFTVPI